MTAVAILLSVVFITVCLAFTVLHSMRVGRLTLIDWAFIGMAGVYGCSWALLALVVKHGGNPSLTDRLLPFEHLYPIHSICSFILASAMVVGWLILGSRRCPKDQRKQQIPPKSIETRLFVAMWFLFSISVFTQLLYSEAYGGFIGMLKYSSLIRSSLFHMSPSNSFSFLKPFGGLALLASFGFFGLWLCNRRRTGVIIGFVFSSLFSIYLLYSWQGRIVFLVYLATFVLGLFLSRQPRPLNLMMKGAATMLAIVVGCYYLSIFLNLKAADNLHVFLAREFSFPFVSFFAQLDFGEHLSRYFIDFLLSPIYLLPSSLWSEWVTSISQINTSLIMGAPKGEHGVTGNIPIDLITLGLMQASVPGVAVVGIMFGVLLRLCQRLIDRLPHSGVRAVFEAYVAFKIAIIGMFYAQPELFISDNFDLLVATVLLIIILKSTRFHLFSKRRYPPTANSFGPGKSDIHSVVCAD